MSILVKERSTVGSYVIDVRKGGLATGRPVILIHGIGVSGRYFMPFAEIMAKRYSVFVLDLPGYGETSKPPHPLSIVELANVVATFVKQERIEQAVIIGQSMGCQTATHAVKSNPRLFKKMILIGPTVNPKERSLFMQAFRLFQDTFIEPARVNRIIFADYIRMGVIRYLRTCRHMLRDRIEETIKGCDMPVCVVRGEKDVIVPRDWARSLAQKASGAFVEIPNGPHVAQYKTAKETAEACIAFIEQ